MMMLNTTTFPTCHMNGTKAEDLKAQYRAAFAALCDAERMMKESEPNGRDYYPQGNVALRLAIHEHNKRLEAVRVLIAAYEQLSEHCDLYCKA